MAGRGVGTLKESHLHASLKEWYSEPGDQFEATVEGFVVDIVRGSALVEIQTSGFSALRRKLDMLLDAYPIRIVHPIAERKWIVRGPHAGKGSARRLSPKRGRACDVFSELVSFPSLLDHPNLSIEVVMTDQEEIRRFDGNTSWRRRGWTVVERRLVDVTDRVVIESPVDLLSLLPAHLEQPFTTADLAEWMGRPRRLGQQCAYCLRESGVIEIAGKTGNALAYRVVPGGGGAPWERA